MKRNKSFDNQQPLLYLIATPIGNLKELSPRAIDILNDVDIVAAEDTRNSKQLLAHYNIYKDMFSLREHNENEASKHIIELIKQGKIKKDKNESTIIKRGNSYFEKIGTTEKCIDDELPFDIPDSWPGTQ